MSKTYTMKKKNEEYITYLIIKYRRRGNNSK